MLWRVMTHMEARGNCVREITFHSLLLYFHLPPPSHPPSNWLRPFFKPNLFPYKYPNILNSSHTSYLLAYEDGTEYSKTLAFKLDAKESTRKKA
jgi:hypothetical protein